MYDSSLHHNRPKLRTTSFIVVIFAVGYAAFLILHLNERKNDFSAVYIWSSAARQGLNPYTDDLKKLERQLGLDDNGNQRANYPPPLIAAFEPITLLSPITAYWVWQFVSLFAVTVTLALLSGHEIIVFAVFALFYEPLTDHFLWAQSYTVVLLLLTISFRAMVSGRDTIAGLSLAAAGALKLFPLFILLYPMRTGRWRVVFSAAAGLLMISVMSIVVLGWKRCDSFLHSTSPQIWVHWAFAHSNVSAGAIIVQVIAPAVKTHSLYNDQISSLFIFVASGLVVSGAVFAVTPASDPQLRAFGLWIIAATWIFPICWPAHMVLFLAFLAMLFCDRKSASREAKWAAVVSCILGVMLLPIHWTLLLAGPIGWLSAIERKCLIMLVLSIFYSAWVFSRPYRPVAGAITTAAEPAPHTLG